MEKDKHESAVEDVLSRFIRRDGAGWFGYWLEYSLFGLLCYVAGGGNLETFMDKLLGIGILIASFGLAVWRGTKEKRELLRLARYIAKLEQESRDNPAP